ncbi:MAG: LEA type 2 family protein [Gemmatimonadota bacterium]|jgi:LEA14-like dessication related protein
MPRSETQLRWQAINRLGNTDLGKAVALGIALAATSGCAALLTPPTVEIVGVELVSLGITSGTVAVVLDVTNEGSRGLNILGLLYDLEVRGSGEGETWERLVGGEHLEEIEIPGKETRRVRIPVPFEYRALGAAVQSFLSRGEVPYRLQGNVSVRGFGTSFDVPFRAEGVIQP